MCFSCLKKAGRDHKAENCSRHQQCSKVENGVRCNGLHHHLLQKEKSYPAGVGVAVAAYDRKSILPFISANMSNSKGFFKRGNVLLDSGAQISLIRQETAEAIVLNGQDVAVTITKVDGEEETLMLTFKCQQDLAPRYLQELLKLRKTSRCTRSACDDLLLEVGKTRLASAGDRAFVNVAPFLWNRLPYSIRACTTVAAFKSRLKTHLFEQYFC